MFNNLLHLTLLVVFFTTSLMSYSCSASEDGIDIFLKAVNERQSHSGIFSGKGSYDLTKIVSGKTKKEIQEECDKMTAEFKRSFPNHPMTETIVRNIPQAVEAKYSKKQTFSGTFRFDYSKNDYEYIENQLIFGGNSRQPITVIEKRPLLERKNQTESAMLDPSISQVSVNHTISTVAEFSEFGRLRGALASLMAGVIAEKGMPIAKDEIKKHLKKIYGNTKELKILEVVETTPFDEGANSYTIESRINGKVTQRYIVVPGMGYICPKIELFDLETQNLVEEYIAKDFVLHQRSGLYYPTNYIESRYNGTSGKLIEKREYKIDQKTLSLNDTMSPKEFSLDVSEGVKIVDMRDGKNVEYSADTLGVLSLAPDGLDLQKMEWLHKAGDITYFQSPNEHIFLRFFFVCIGLGLMIFGIYMRIKKKKKSFGTYFTSFFSFVRPGMFWGRKRYNGRSYENNYCSL